jgi:lipid II:glycine glycyltransferase (peptidoglycan interpeptide bridge formation enzyme)
MKLEFINDIKPEIWDMKISRLKTRHLFHCSSWIKFLQETQLVQPIHFRITVNGRVMGFFVGFLLKKGIFRILGSPLSGWETEQMGPIVNEDFNTEAFLSALDKLCRQRKIHQIEIGNPYLSPEIMQKNGYGVTKWMTFLIPLSIDQDQMWKGVKSKCRNRVRKGIKNNLVVDDCDDESFVDEHYRQLLDVYAKQHLEPPFPIEFYRSLFRNLKPNKLLYTLQVKHDTQVVASGVFCHDNNTVYSLSTASYRKFQNLYPNELLHWTLMSMAGSQGIKSYNLGDNYRVSGSGGKFKNKFNGSYETVYRYVKSYSIFAKYGRQAYKLFQNSRQNIKAKLKR